MPIPALMLGPLDLMAAPYATDVAMDFGAPVPEVVALPRALLDGEVVSGRRSSNRQITFRVKITAATYADLATHEATLVRQVDAARNTLSWAPPGAPVTVFDTFRGTLTYDYDEKRDRNLERVYTLTLPALPYGRSAVAVATTALTAGTGADTQLDACDAATGWAVTTLPAGGTLAVDTTWKSQGTGSLATTQAAYYTDAGGGRRRYAKTATFTKTLAAFDMTTTPYLTVQAFNGSCETLEVTATVDGVAVPLVATAAEVNQWTRFYFTSADASATVVTFTVTMTYVAEGPYYNLPSWWTPRIDDVRRVPLPPASGTSSTAARALMQSVPVSGSVRSPGSLAVSTAGAGGLGKLLAFTMADANDGFWPGLRRYRTAGGSLFTPAAGTYSNAQDAINTGATPGFEAQVPVAALPEGGYLVVLSADVLTGGSSPLWVLTADTVVNGTVVGTSPAQTIRANGGGMGTPVVMGVLHLPSPRLPQESAGVVRFRLTQSSGSSRSVDEVYLFPLAGALTMVDAGTAKRVWIDAPSVDVPLGGVWVGNAADRTDAYAAQGVIASETPQMVPPRSRVFLASPTVSDLMAPAFVHYPAFLHSAAAQ